DHPRGSDGRGGCRRALPGEPGAGAGDAQEGARRDEDARPARGAAGLGDSRRPARRFAAPALLHLVCELSRDLAGGAVEVTPSSLSVHVALPPSVAWYVNM